MSEPKDHHYVPVFYLSRWEGPDGCICRFSRPYGNEVKAMRVVPKGTAFEAELYRTHGLPPDQAQTMEKDFMAKIDDDAAKALTLLEKGLPGKGLTSAARNGWSRFLVTQMLRAPRDIAQLKSSVKQDWNLNAKALRERYAAIKSSSDPATLEEYIARQNPAYEDEFAFSIARTLMEHSIICNLLNEMHWCVLDDPQECDPLLTSDNPVWMTPTLTKDDGFLWVAIGPRRLFAASVKPETQRRLQAQPRGELVKNINKITVQHAERFVYGQTEDMLPFVQEHLSSRRHSTWLERLAAIRGHATVASGQ
ncbi:MAG TPA: DUF4238 domain-containing protein [Terracidiphilus sp.]|jgi:hypothetical protein|nr:DUF4238 domain-containing protein [Terracidiphilus sp.]